MPRHARTRNVGFSREAAAHGGTAAAHRAEGSDLIALDPVTSERQYSDDEFELLRAMAAYQQRTGRRYPTYAEVLGVLRSLGWRKG